MRREHKNNRSRVIALNQRERNLKLTWEGLDHICFAYPFWREMILKEEDIQSQTGIPKHFRSFKGLEKQLKLLKPYHLDPVPNSENKGEQDE